jgi:lipopolysaccharide transport system ATP-binding protein
VSCQLLSLALGFVPHLSGRDNAVLSGLMLGLRRREIMQRLPAILEFSELGDFFDQPISSYSTGMTMRLGFSVAMQVEPDVLLIDEVLAVGDAIPAEIQRAARAHPTAKTIVFVSHDDKQISRSAIALMIEHRRSMMQGPSRPCWRHHGRPSPPPAGS